MKPVSDIPVVDPSSVHWRSVPAGTSRRKGSNSRDETESPTEEGPASLMFSGPHFM